MENVPPALALLLFALLTSFFAIEIFAFCLEPALRSASATAFFIAFDDIVAPETESTSTLPLLRILSMTAFALLKYSGVSVWDITLISVSFPSLMVIRTVRGPP